MKPTVRVVGRGKPMPLERYSDTIPSGRFAGGDHVGFEDAHAEGVDFSGRRFEYLQTVGSTFVDCDFSGVVLKSGALSPGRQSRFIGCRFDGIRPGPTIWGISRFEGCSFERLRLKGWDARACEFVDCRFSGRVDSLVLFGRLQPPYDEPDRVHPWRDRNELRGNDFSRLDLRFPDLRWGVDMASNRWPASPDYLFLDRWPERLMGALAIVSRWPEDEQRERALWWLGLQRKDGRGEQTDMLIRIDDWTSPPSETWGRLWATLRLDP